MSEFKNSLKKQLMKQGQMTVVQADTQGRPYNRLNKRTEGNVGIFI